MTLIPILAALRFHDRESAALEKLSEDDWSGILKIADREGLTPALGLRCAEYLPPAARVRVEKNLADNALRHAALVETYRTIAGTLAAESIEYAVLKGISQQPHYVDDQRFRPQYDIDIYCPDESIGAARRAIAGLGYEAVRAGHQDDDNTDHLPTMIRRTGWTWCDDYFDPAMPASIELHFRFWDEQTEHISIPGLQTFWTRRVMRDLGEVTLPSLHPVDGLTYTALHLARHVLRGNLRAYHVYELAHFLERSAADEAFWSEWQANHIAGAATIEGIAFRLAHAWFHCKMHAAARCAVDRLSPRIGRWFELFALSPAIAPERPNKDELWLHLCLIESARYRREVARRRLLPLRRSRVVLDAHVGPARNGPGLKVRRALYETAFIAGRAAHHARALLSMLRSAIRWWS